MVMKYSADELFRECAGHQARYDVIKGFLEGVKTVIDMGAGAGNLAEQLSDKKVKCLDVRSDYVDFMLKRGLDAENVDIEDTAKTVTFQADAVVLAEVMEHVENPGVVLANAFDSAKDIVVITLPVSQQKDPDHKWNVWIEKTDVWAVIKFQRIK